MTYAYENLGDERFQQLCQAILTTVHSDVQCLPVGQPDGGRDALLQNPLLRRMLRNRQDSVIFQVKYSKDPSSKDERTVIEELINSESAKIDRLKERGLQRYYLMTNVSGTSHRDVGSIDRVNEELSRKFGIPAYCWWRDDLDRRVDANSSIKWSFPDIIRGSDILQALFEGKFGGEENRRLSVIKAYLAHQYKYDSQLKFKQVDLEKGLIDLFVDVPAAAMGPSDLRERQEWKARFATSHVFAALVSDERTRPRRDDEDRIGAVRALAASEVAAAFPRVVIEGAPGQGKSTVTQFLCQLHRMLLLNKWEISKVPAELRPADVRLPLRIDLRDYATWLSGRSPFQDADLQSIAASASPALETFLAAQISAQSGGMEFKADDLLAFAAHSALLIVLDGFDEVADIGTRNRLVREISDASTRLEGNSISHQVIVTSRPAAFANSPGFPKSEWQYIQILPLTRSVISIYTDKWMSGHNLDKKERRDITSVLDEKLEYPHVRELARNPMQLAILLALISTQGASLPDKRTTLYDRYIDIFFNRESEKSRVVRDKRDLLIDIHRYLAWTLQVEVESDKKAGNISEQRLREVLREYLTRLGHKAELVDDIFSGMVERVVALVSRVQGTFEFEVQPLREYFAARYLYDTVPYIPAGSSRSGSIMDRFEALARNAYWLNVTRFYCGCYSSGELSSLVDGLTSIAASEQYTGTLYVSDLTLTLLGDYVFSQQPRLVDRLTDFFFEKNRFRLMLAGYLEEPNDNGVSLPEGSGRAKLLETATSAFEASQHFDTAYSSAGFVRANLGTESAIDIWRDARSKFSAEQAVLFGGFMQITEATPAEELLELVEEGGFKALRACVYRDRLDVLRLRPALWREFFEQSLDGSGRWYSYRGLSHEAECVQASTSRCVLVLLGAIAGMEEEEPGEEGGTLFNHARHHVGYVSEPSEIDIQVFESTTEDKILQNVEICRSANALINMEMSRSLEFEEAVSSFLSELVNEYGYKSLIVDAALGALQWFGRGPEVMRYTGILDIAANMQRHSWEPMWWKERLVSALDSEDRLLVVKAYLIWIDQVDLVSSIQQFSNLVDNLPTVEFHSLFNSKTGMHSAYPPENDSVKFELPSVDLANLGVRAAALLYQMVGSKDRDILFLSILEPYDGEDEDILVARSNGAWHCAIMDPSFWPKAMAIIAHGYAHGVALESLMGPRRRVALPVPEAKNVVQEPRLYPLKVISAAEFALAERTGTQVIPVGSVAARDEWFVLG